MQESGGHCFGISRFVQEIGARRDHATRQFASGVTTTFGLPSRSGPSGRARRLPRPPPCRPDDEGVPAAPTALRDDSISAQLDRLRSELTAGRLPGLMRQERLHRGPRHHGPRHRDAARRLDGHPHLRQRARVHPRGGDRHDGATHRDREAGSQVVINAAKTPLGLQRLARRQQRLLLHQHADGLARGHAPTLPGVVERSSGSSGRPAARRSPAASPRARRSCRCSTAARSPARRASSSASGEDEERQPRHGGREGRHLRPDDHGRRLHRRGARREDGEGRDRPPDRRPRRRHDHVRGRADAGAAARGRLASGKSREPRRDDRTRSTFAGGSETVSLPRRLVARATSTTARRRASRSSFRASSAARRRRTSSPGPLRDRQGRADRRDAGGLAPAGQRARVRAPRERQGHDAPDPQPRARAR